MDLIGYDSDSSGYEVPNKKDSRLIKLYKKHKGLCQLCLLPCDIEDATVDHVIPKSKGKRHNNTQLAHKKCNQLKADNDQKKPEHYRN